MIDYAPRSLFYVYMQWNNPEIKNKVCVPLSGFVFLFPYSERERERESSSFPMKTMSATHDSQSNANAISNTSNSALAKHLNRDCVGVRWPFVGPYHG